MGVNIPRKKIKAIEFKAIQSFILIVTLVLSQFLQNHFRYTVLLSLEAIYSFFVTFWNVLPQASQVPLGSWLPLSSRLLACALSALQPRSLYISYYLSVLFFSFYRHQNTNISIPRLTVLLHPTNLMPVLITARQNPFLRTPLTNGL